MANFFTLLADIPAPTGTEMAISLGVILFIAIVVLAIMFFTIYGFVCFLNRLPNKKTQNRK